MGLFVKFIGLMPLFLQVLKNKIILISLYVDDKRDLPENEQYTSELTGKKATIIGKKWSEFQIEKYKANVQPYYVLIYNNGDNLNEHTAYITLIEEYLAWLNEEISGFKKNCNFSFNFFLNGESFYR